MYADDMALVAPSLKGLQILLKACESFCIDWDISLNPKKTKNMAFGKNLSNLGSLYLDGNRLDWVSSWKYLGIDLQSHARFNCSVDEKLKSFYKCLNAILRIEGRSNELVMLRLLESHCVSILTYGIEVIQVSNQEEIRRLRVAYNTVFRKIFYYKWNESVRELQGFLNRPTWEELMQKRLDNFIRKLPSGNMPLSLEPLM